MFTVLCKKACAETGCHRPLLTAGMANAETIKFNFSADWDTLTKTAVFTDGKVTIDVLQSRWLTGNTVTIPHEILTTAGRTARVGVYGADESGVVLPTVWVSLGKVQPGADPSGDASTDPTLPVWAQLQEIIGDLNNLTTTDKENLVAAINEAAKTSSGGGSIDLRVADGYIQYSNDGGTTWENLIALADLKGEDATVTAGNIESALGYKPASTDNVNQLKQDLVNAIDYVEVDNVIEIDAKAGYFAPGNGYLNWTADINRKSAIVTIDNSKRYKLTTNIRSAVIYGLICIRADNPTPEKLFYCTILDKKYKGNGTDQVISEEIVIPDGCTHIVIQSTNKTEPVLCDIAETPVFKAYTKEESDAKYKPIGFSDGIKRYGVKWSIEDSNDLGQRCFDAVGMTAEIGVGSTNGYSDFDLVYPWSEMKRCNIAVNENGGKSVVFEGESGFALDGSNGDVFVRIPKFFYEHFEKNGEEYFVVCENGTTVHPAFVEDGKVLDDIFVGAFEAKEVGGKLRSIGGVIPTNNITGQQFIEYSNANGDGYSIYDMRCISAIWMLMAVEYGCRNSNRIIGYGAADYWNATSSVSSTKDESDTNSITVPKLSPGKIHNMPVGSNVLICDGNQTNILTQAKLLSITHTDTESTLTFDGDAVNITTNCFVGSAPLSTNFCENAPSGALSWHTGRASWITGSGALTQNPCRYRWIENIVGNLWHFIPDVRFDDRQMYVCNNIAKYDLGNTISQDYMPVGDIYEEQGSNGSKSDNENVNYWVSKIKEEYFAKGILFGSGYDMSLTSKKAFGGYYYLNNGIVNIVNGGGFDHLYRCNMLTNRAWIRPYSVWYLYGARLLYKHMK